MSKKFQKVEAANAADTASSPLRPVVIKLLVLIHFVCPLLFFTNLTRNPYFSQIALLNIALALGAALWCIDGWRRREIILPLGPERWPLAAFLVVGLASTTASYVIHPALRPGIFYEGVRVWVFTLINSIAAFYLPRLYTSPTSSTERPLSIWTDIICTVMWGLMWFPFNDMRSQQTLLWDPYGAFLWIIAIVYWLLRVRKGEAVEFFHIIFSVAILAGLYGLVQYMGRDFIWSSPVQPYGGRPVSTFGNPNFLSSYLLVVSPVAVAYALRSKGSQATGYMVVAAISVVSALCTLTRSTYVGLFAAFLVMGVLLFNRENIALLKKPLIWAGVVIGLILIFPKTPIMPMSPLKRFTEIFEAMEAGRAYGPWHQRMLIWSSAWDMARERLWLGKGWGEFELFYPFYQGRYLLQDLYMPFRTHANNAHNILMELWSQLGILGTGVAIWLGTALLAGGVRVVRGQTDISKKLIAAGLLAGWVGMIVDNFFGNVSIFFAVPAFLFWWNLGAMFGEAKAVTTVTRPVTGAIHILLAAVFFVSIVSGVYYVRRWQQELYYFEGFKLAKTGDVPNSIKSLEKAVAAFPGEVNTDYELGNSYARYGKALAEKKYDEESKKYIAKAVDAYSLALKGNPGYDEIYFNLGITQFQSGMQKEAINNFRLSLLINPLMDQAYSYLGQYYLNQSNFSEAVKIYRQATMAFPKNRDYLINLGFCLAKNGEQQKALEAFRKAFQIDPGSMQAWNNLKETSQKLKVTEPLLEVPSLIEKMNGHIRDHQFEEAHKISVRLVELLPQQKDVGLSNANLLFLLGRIDESVAEYRRVIALEPKFGAAHLNLGQLYQKQGKTELARVEYQTALDINPNDADAQKGLASLGNH